MVEHFLKLGGPFGGASSSPRVRAFPAQDINYKCGRRFVCLGPIDETCTRSIQHNGSFGGQQEQVCAANAGESATARVLKVTLYRTLLNCGTNTLV